MIFERLEQGRKDQSFLNPVILQGQVQSPVPQIVFHPCPEWDGCLNGPIDCRDFSMSSMKAFYKFRD